MQGSPQNSRPTEPLNGLLGLYYHVVQSGDGQLDLRGRLDLPTIKHFRAKGPVFLGIHGIQLKHYTSYLSSTLTACATCAGRLHNRRKVPGLEENPGRQSPDRNNSNN